ncbi:MAG: aminopeptidase P family protein [Candidatus Nanopelagicaceae bacterium]|jgi:Xaa-Pro aminopeptidase
MSEISKRVHDSAPSDAFAEFMKGNWSAIPLSDLGVSPVASNCVARRAVLSAAFKGLRIVLPSGIDKVRSNDTFYLYRPHSAFAYYTGVQGVEANPDAVLVLEPNGDGHDPILFIMPRSTRDTEAFYRDSKYGELWVGRRYTTDDAKQRYQIETRSVDELEKFLSDKKPAVTIREEDPKVDALIASHDRDAELVEFTSAQRFVKDKYEIAELQKAVDATGRGFEDMIKVLPEATKHERGERVVEGAFYARARAEGNDLGYNTIAASGSHACVLHWVRNDGPVKSGDLMLIDAGIEMDSYYTADITRTLPVNGKFTHAQRELYMLVYNAQKAGFAAAKAGATIPDINRACQEVLAAGLEKLGALPVSAAESLEPQNGFHRRWTLHNVSHMLGMDVHDCAHAKRDVYMGKLEAGMVITVEPGLYIQPDDELFPPEYRGIGIRIEDDVVITENDCINLSEKLPRHPDEIEAWMASVSK